MIQSLLDYIFIRSSKIIYFYVIFSIISARYFKPWYKLNDQSPSGQVAISSIPPKKLASLLPVRSVGSEVQTDWPTWVQTLHHQIDGMCWQLRRNCGNWRRCLQWKMQVRGWTTLASIDTCILKPPSWSVGWQHSDVVAYIFLKVEKNSSEENVRKVRVLLLCLKKIISYKKIMKIILKIVTHTFHNHPKSQSEIVFIVS
jgi:hypothetical protein